MTEGSNPNNQPPSKPTRKRRYRWLLGLLIFFLFLPLLLALVAYWVLRSPVLHSHIWPRVQPIIAEQSGFHVDLESLKVDLLGHIQVTGLQVHNLEPQAEFCEDLQLTLDEVDLAFRPWALLSGELHIDLLAVRHLDVSGCLLIDLPPAAEPAQPLPSPEEQLAPVLELLEQPPLAIHLHQLVLEEIQADLRLELPSEQLQLAWQGQLDLETQLHWTQEALQGQLQAQLTSLAPLQVDQQADEQLYLSVLPQLQADLGWQLQRSSPWFLELSPLQMDLQLNDLDLQLSADDLTLAAQWPEYRFQLQKAGHLNLQLAELWPLNSELLLTSQLSQGEIQLKTPEVELQTRIHQGLRLEALGHLDLLAPNLENLQLEIASQQGLQELLVAAEGQQLSLNQLLLTLQAGSYGEQLDTASQGDFLLGLNLDIEQLEADPLLKPVNLHPQLQLQLRQDFSQASLSSQFFLDHLELLTLNLEVLNLAERLELTPRLAAQVPLELQDYLAEAAELQELGALAVKLNGHSVWEHGENNLFQADWNQLPWGDLHQNLQLELAQTSTPTGDLRLTQPLLADLNLVSSLDSGQHQLNLELTSELLHPPLLKPLPVSLGLNVQTDELLTALTTEGQIALNQLPFVNWQLALDNQPQQLKLQGQLQADAHPEWQLFITEVAELDALGPISWQQSFDIHLQHPESTLLELDPEQWEALVLQAQLNGQLTQTSPPENAEIQLLAPLNLDKQLAWSPEEAKMDVALQLPAALLPEGMEVNGINLALNLTADSGIEPQELQLGLTFDQEQLHLPDQLLLEALAVSLALDVQLLEEQLASQLLLDTHAERLEVYLPDQETLSLASLVFPLSLSSSMRADWVEEQAYLDELLLTVGNAWLEQSLQAESDFAGQRLLAEGQTQISLRDELFSAITGPMQGQGQLLVPWSLSLVELEQLTLEALADFNQFSLQLPDAGLNALHGQIRIQQELDLLDLERLRFSYLLQPDAFQRVDFNRVEPWLDSRRDFSIAAVQLDDLVFGPLEATFSIEQNLIRLQDFSVQALNGEVAGQFYLDINPAGWRLGLLSRLSRVDLRELLPETLAATAYAPVNARTALEFDFSQRLAEGRVDLTDINRTQLLQLLDIIDPDHRDPQLATARSALRAAHPRWVRAEMQNGLMDLTLGLSLFRDPIYVRNLPLTPLIERFAEEALLLPELLPLESTP